MNPLIYYKKFDTPKHVITKIGDKTHEYDVFGEWTCDHPMVKQAKMMGMTSSKIDSPIYAAWYVILKNGAREEFVINNYEDYSEDFEKIKKWIESNPQPPTQTIPSSDSNIVSSTEKLLK